MVFVPNSIPEENTIAIHHDQLQQVQKIGASRLERDLKGFVKEVQDTYHRQVAAEHFERQQQAKSELFQALQEEKMQDLEKRLFEPARARQHSCRKARQRRDEIQQEENLKREAINGEKTASFLRLREEVAQQRQAEAAARELHCKMAAVRAQAMELERAVEEARRQELRAERRSEVLAAVMEAQWRQAEQKRQKEQMAQARVEAALDRRSVERRRYAERLEAKSMRLERRMAKKDEVLSGLSSMREEMSALRSELVSMLSEAKRTGEWQALFDRLDRLGLKPKGSKWPCEHTSQSPEHSPSGHFHRDPMMPLRPMTR
mmetsp:Transcript_59961/g.126944  ORF Transcript_59961/g.126944 Transcript_59961/m.126944 type:complete len:318 (+) Transcript_59961:80-1033(+)